MLVRVQTILEKALSDCNGILRLAPCWVARDLIPPGRRLGLPEDAYDRGERGFVCERWLGSTTHTENRVGPDDEGLSYLVLDGSPRLTLKHAVEAAPSLIMGNAYAASHSGLGRLAKIFDYGDRLPYHLHLRASHAALVGRNPKDEAYYYPEGFDLGPHPEIFLGVHPWIVEEGAFEVLLPYLIEWTSNQIVSHSRAELQVPTEGFEVPSGVLHAPGTAVTIELQEDSDVSVMLQALNGGRIIPKDRMFKYVRAEDRQRYGERFILELIDWKANGDPYFYENHHLSPRLIKESYQSGGEEHWVYYNTTKFSGKKLVVRAASSYRSIDRGAFNLLVLQGTGLIGKLRVVGGDPTMDELLVSHSAAVAGVDIVNDDPRRDMVVIKFFGPDVNSDVPMIAQRNELTH
jgi:hypothetical protein